jgi:hypothetical protein
MAKYDNANAFTLSSFVFLSIEMRNIFQQHYRLGNASIISRNERISYVAQQPVRVIVCSHHLKHFFTLRTPKMHYFGRKTKPALPHQILHSVTTIEILTGCIDFPQKKYGSEAKYSTF